MNQCRICLSSVSNSEVGRIITPCKCRGIFAYVHDKCVSKWVEDYDCNYCDICRFKYIMIRTSKGYYEWIKEDKDQIIDMILLLIGTIFSLYLIFISFTLLYYSFNFIDIYSSVILFMSTLFWTSGYSLLVYKLISRNLLHFKDWRRTNFHIQVLNYEREVEPHTVPRSVHRTSGLRHSGVDFSNKSAYQSVHIHKT